MVKKRNVLIITYYWPPAGGPGVQRLLKFVKYLPKFGWNPIILTVAKGNFPAIDQSLQNEINPDIEVFKTAHFEPDMLYKKFIKKQNSIPVAVLAQKNLNWKQKLAHFVRLNLFIPDAKICWLFPALKKAEEIIRTHNIDLIYSSSPPPTTHLIAQKIKQKFKIKWIADFRDPWTNIHYYKDSNRTWLAKKIDEKLEKKVINNCDGITTASSLFQKLLPISKGKSCITITNGFDDEVIDLEVTHDNDFTLVHTGGITSNRYYIEFFTGLKNFIDDSGIKNLKLVLVGKVNPEIIDKIKHYIPENCLQITGYLNHGQALKKMKAAAVNIIFLEKMKNYQGHIPGKIFEYIAVQRPVLGAGDPSGDAAEIIRKSGCGNIFPAQSNWQDILSEYYKNWMNNINPSVNTDFIEVFHRSRLTKKLADFFRDIV